MTMITREPCFSYARKDFLSNFEKIGFKLKHNVTNHPLLSFDSLMNLANKLPRKNIEFNSGDVAKNYTRENKPEHNFTVEEIFNNIKTCKTWLGLKKIEQIPEYKELMDDLLDSVQQDIENLAGKTFNRECFVFITSPNSTVPYHMDPEHNFLVQIQGVKYFKIFDKSNHNVLTETQIEKYYSGYRPENRKLIYDEKLEQFGENVIIEPGDVFHVPICSPHYVNNNDEVSISLSVTFSSKWADDREAIYHLNSKLRKMCINPIKYGQSKIIDKLKLSALGLLRYFRSN